MREANGIGISGYWRGILVRRRALEGTISGRGARDVLNR